MLIVATDGLWDHMSNDEVVAIASQHSNANFAGRRHTVYASQSYVTCITIVDTIILTIYTNDAYTYDTYTPRSGRADLRGAEEVAGAGGECGRRLCVCRAAQGLLGVLNPIFLGVF
jgi:hypothetical protein